MIMTRLILMVSLILLWTKEVKANPLHYTLRYRESTERRQSKVAAAGGGKHKGVSSTPKRRSLQGEDRSREYLELCRRGGKAERGRSGKGAKENGRRFLQFPCQEDFSIPTGTPTRAVVADDDAADDDAGDDAPSDSPTPASTPEDNDDGELSNEGFEEEEPSNEGFDMDRSQFQGGDPIVGIPIGDDDDNTVGTDDGEVSNDEDFPST